LKPYVKLKKLHIILALKIHSLLKKTLAKFIEAAELTDKFAGLNYSKKRTHTSFSKFKKLFKAT